jgi:hypothetical protein
MRTLASIYVILAVLLIQAVPCLSQDTGLVVATPPAQQAVTEERAWADTTYMQLSPPIEVVPGWKKLVEPKNLMKLRCVVINKYHGTTYPFPSVATLEESFQNTLKNRKLDPNQFTVVQVLPVLWKNVTHVAWYIMFIETKHVNFPEDKKEAKKESTETKTP